ncbi:alpha-glucosidase-like [Planococcus citri]|uniref:alpha-glucosidase-like n=1 Tax=Planococcus citri TaxID=170843 RepID=UPI0031F7F0BF
MILSFNSSAQCEKKDRNMFIVHFKLLTISLLITAGKSFSLDTDWWKHTILYEIYVQSFKDSNGDGMGDIKGITNKLDHFVDLGIETLYLSPFFLSPMLDSGYDVSSFTEINPLFGTMDDFNELMSEMKRRGLKLICDLVINHSSDEHPWFRKSIERIDPYTNFYVWVDPKGYDSKRQPIIPNNWMSLFGGSAWEWNEKRGQFYLHQFAIKQPDFNLRDAELKKEIKKIMKFWLVRGVAGFRLDATKHFIEDKYFRDEPLVDPNKTEITTSNDLKHIYTTDLWESYEFIHELRDFTDQYTAGKANRQHLERILVPEAYTDVNHTMAYYGTNDYSIAHFPFNFVFATLYKFANATLYDHRILEWLKYMPKDATPNWVADNHDTVRTGSRLCEEYMDIVTITMMMLPGIACIYYGQEIGMTNSKVRPDQRQDPNNDGAISRDGERLPMQWDDTMNSGFTSKYKPWLPAHPNYWQVNVEKQKSQEISRYNIFKALSQIRKRKTMKIGDFKSYIVSEWVYAFTRSYRRYETYITVLNLGSEIELINLHDVIGKLPSTMQVVVASVNAGYVKGDQIQSTPKFPRLFSMRPLSAIVLTTRAQTKPPIFRTQPIDPRINKNSL